MTLLGRPIVEAARSVRVSLDVAVLVRQIAERGVCRHPFPTLESLLGEARDATEPTDLRRVFVEIAAVCQCAAEGIDKENDRG